MSVFHEPWWMDAVAPGRWGEVSISAGGEVIARLPFAERTFGGFFRRLGAPPLTPRLGPLLDIRAENPARRLQAEVDLTCQLLAALPPHDLYLTTTGYDITNSQPYLWSGCDVQPRVSYMVDLRRPVDAIRSDFRSRAKRAVKKATRSLAVEIDDGVDRLLTMARATFARQQQTLPFPTELLQRAHSAAHHRRCCEILTAVDAGGAVHASMLTVWDKERATYLVGGADPEHRSSGAQSLLLWEAMQRSRGRASWFDFEGSMVPAIAEFMSGFGAVPQPYFRLLRASRAIRVALAGRSAVRAVRGSHPEDF